MEIRSISCEMTWSIRQAAMWPSESIAYVMLPNDKEGAHFGLFVNDQIVSVISMFLVDDHAQFRKFATLDAEQGKGYGSKLLNHIFLELAKSGITKVWCNARADKTDFYERFGMIQTEKRFDKGGINYVIMEKSI